MKNISKILKYAFSIVLASVLVTSCDKEADKIEIETKTLEYSGTFYLAINAPDYMMEQYAAYFGGQSFDLCNDSLKGKMTLDVSSEGYSVLNFVPDQEIKFKMPFLYNANAASEGEMLIIDVDDPSLVALPIPAFDEGPLAKMFMTVYDDPNVTVDEYYNVVKLLSTVDNTVKLPAFKTSRIPLVQQGASIVSYDEEQNSFYSEFSIGDVAYTYSGNIGAAVTYVKDNLVSKMDAANKTTAQNSISEIENILASMTGVIKNGWGWTTLGYANNTCELDMHIESTSERPNELLAILSKILFGQNGEGNPKQDLWLTIYYVGFQGGNYWDWEEVK